MTTFDYDPTGRLWRMRREGVSTEFLFDGDALVAEYNSSGQLTRRYLHGDQIDEPWVEYQGSAVNAPARRYLHSDHRGSIIAHSHTAGNTQAILSYDAYGNAGVNNQGRFGFAGQLFFADTGLYYYKARFYNPRAGRFMQTDPIDTRME